LISSATFPMEKLWLRDDAHSLSVEALGETTILFPLAVTTTVTLNNAPRDNPGRLYLPALDGTSVSVDAPATVNTALGKADFDEWILNGSPAGNTTKIAFTLSENSQLVALYELEESLEFLPGPTNIYLPFIEK